MTKASFIVDSGPNVGLGHLGRSLVLLKALERHGVACTLYCTDPSAAGAMGWRGEPVPDFATLPATDLVFCDSYRITDDDFRSLKSRGRLIATMDDTADRPLPVDVVINHNLYAPRLDYARVTNAKVLAGPDYALVDERVMAAQARHRAAQPADGVVISFGGTDDGTVAADVAATLLPSADGPINIIVAASRTPAKHLARLGRGITVHHGPDVPNLLADARLYLGSAGMMAFEAFTIGLELVVVPIADNQRPGAEALVAFGHDMIQTIDPIALAELAARRLRKPPSAMPAPIDGKGGDRIATALLAILA